MGTVSDPERAAAHLATDLARYYDLDLDGCDPGDLDLYLALAHRTGGPVLELGVGTGRLAVPLALAGHQVVGVDLDPVMLARARTRWERARGRRAARRLRLLEGDLTSVRLGERFGLAILALDTLCLLDGPAARAAALRTMATQLRTGGLAVVDVSLPTPDDLAQQDGRLLLDWVRPDPETGELVTRLLSARHDPTLATTTLTQLYDAWTPGGRVRRTVRTDRLHLVGTVELERLATDSGLSVEVLAGDHQVTPISPGDQRVVLVARAV
jgi:SAM-dependent methyltransferase